MSECIPPGESFDCKYRCKTPAPTTAHRTTSLSTSIAKTSLGATTAETTPATTSTVFTTLPPTNSSAPDILPDPYVTMTLNGTFYTASNIVDVSCVNQYTTAFKSNFKDTIQRASGAIGRGDLCAGNTGNDVTLLAGSVILRTYTNIGTVQLDLVVIAGNTTTIRNVELCAWEANLFLQDFNNWRQPVIDSGPFCDEANFSPQYVQLKASAWNCL
jgi:hypothetical protein